MAEALVKADGAGCDALPRALDDDSPLISRKPYDVAVVGAGVAGLQLAVALQREHGIDNIVVLEARGRVGGRLLSVPSTTVPNTPQRLDLGATWYWPSSEPLVDTLVREASAGPDATRLQPFTQHYRGDMLFVRGAGSDASRHPNELDHPGTGRVRQGMAGIAQHLLRNIHWGSDTVRLHHRVEAVTRDDDTGVFEIRGTHGENAAAPFRLAARWVVLAVPPALVASRIAFTPSLPPPLLGIAHQTPVWMGTAVKCVVEFSGGPFWRAAGLAGSAHDGAAATGPMQEIHDMGTDTDGDVGALFGFAFPAPGDTVTEAQVRRQVEALFGRVVGYVRPSAVYIMDWRQEAWTSPPGGERLTNRRGTYGHPVFRAAGHEAGYVARLLWCSTETATHAPGHVEGALEAARTAAKTIASAMPMS